METRRGPDAQLSCSIPFIPFHRPHETPRADMTNALSLSPPQGMILVTFILRRYNRELQTSEMFTTAGRTVKSGLVGSAVVSSWTWAATLLQSTGVCYRYGVSGPFWYASGATVQILLFATLAIELKRRAPNAHTFLEVIRARYGTLPHLVFMAFGLVTNVLVSLMLIVGGSATVNALTGMHTIAAIYLLPVGVVGTWRTTSPGPCGFARGFDH